MDVACEIEYDDVEVPDEEGTYAPGVVVTCQRCQHTAECLGDGSSSLEKCFAALKAECPRHEANNYYSDDA